MKMSEVVLFFRSNKRLLNMMSESEEVDVPSNSNNLGLIDRLNMDKKCPLSIRMCKPRFHEVFILKKF